MRLSPYLSRLGLASPRQKLQRLRVCNGDVFYPIVRTFSGRLKRLEVKPAERIVSNDIHLATLLNHGLRRLDEQVIKALPGCVRLRQHVLGRENQLRVLLNEWEYGLAACDLIELLPRGGDRPRGMRFWDASE